MINMIYKKMIPQLNEIVKEKKSLKIVDNDATNFILIILLEHYVLNT